MLEKIRKQNPNFEIMELSSKSFAPYGKVFPNVELPEMTRFVKNLEMPENEIYIPDSKELYDFSEADVFKKNIYGQVPCHIGYYLASKNTKLNAFEYHKCSEILGIMEDEILVLGKIEEIENGTYHTKNVKIFYAPKGTVVELYGTTLHFAPATVSIKNGVRQIVVQAKSTNTPLNEPIIDKTGENKYLLEKNKWVLAHKDAENLIKQGAYIGLVGENVEIKPILD